ncbi:MAG: response regulator transcription factor [Sideroxydans sp.]|nr:response regulator transcription factor [Sideroxydans sp.]
MTKIIFAEDNRSYAEDVADFLAEAGYAIEIAASASELWNALSKGHFDVVLLDLGLPDEDGFHVIPQLRKLYPDTGLIVLTARVATDNRIQGLRLGADCYLTKPIKFPELAAQIEALCRRVRPKLDKEPSAWVLKITGRQLELKGKGIVALTEKEFDFLHLLAQNKQPVPRKSLLFGMGEKFDPEVTGKMDMLVYRLRKKVQTSLGEELPLRSEYGGGYALSVPFQIV